MLLDRQTDTQEIKLDLLCIGGLLSQGCSEPCALQSMETRISLVQHNFIIHQLPF